MSDSGTYEAICAELVAALSVPSIEDAKAIIPTCSLADLFGMDAKRFPAIGVIEREAARDPKDQLIALRPVRAITVWDVAIVVQNMRGSIAGRSLLRVLMETTRDRIHGLRSAIAPKAQFTWQADKLIDNVGDGSVAASVTTFTLPVNFAK